MNATFQVGIMGAGRIAQGFDEPGSERVLTLAHAVRKSPQLQLAGFYDRVPERAENAERKWACPPSARDREAWLDSGWDIVLIATPDECHVDDFEDVLRRRPKAVMVEKPLAPSVADTRRLVTQAREQSTAVLVDFPRRWHPGVRHIGEALATGEFGTMRRISANISGGLRHNGVHLLDLIAAWCPAIESVRLVVQEQDAAWFVLETKQGGIDFHFSRSVQAGCYVCDLRFETEHARIEFCDSPEILRLSRPAGHPNYPGYQALICERTWPMEDEPILVGMLAHLTELIGNPEAADAQAKLEIEREEFFAEVLQHFDS